MKMERSSETFREVAYWTAVVVVVLVSLAFLILSSPYWLVRYIYRTATGKNSRMRGSMLYEDWSL